MEKIPEAAYIQLYLAMDGILNDGPGFLVWWIEHGSPCGSSDFLECYITSDEFASHLRERSAEGFLGMLARLITAGVGTKLTRLDIFTDSVGFCLILPLLGDAGKWQRNLAHLVIHMPVVERAVLASLKTYPTQLKNN